MHEIVQEEDMILTVYASGALSQSRLSQVQERFPVVDAEFRIYCQFGSSRLAPNVTRIIKEVVRGNVPGIQVSEYGSFLLDDHTDEPVTMEVGPRLNTESPWGTRARIILERCGVSDLVRIERSICYRFAHELPEATRSLFFSTYHDNMLEVEYVRSPTTLVPLYVPPPLASLSLEGGMESPLVRYARARGFEVLPEHLERMQRMVGQRGYDLTEADVWTIFEPDSDHSRHHGFNDHHTINGVALPQSFMQRVRSTYEKNPGNARIAFDDDAAGLDPETRVTMLIPDATGRYQLRSIPLTLLLKMESHNHPTFIEPYHGAATGLGGVLRDVFSTRRGGHISGVTFGLIVGACKLPDHPRRFDAYSYQSPAEYADARRILLDGRDGAYQYANPVGYPFLTGFVYELWGEVVDDGKVVHYESLKPVAACGSVGWLLNSNDRRRNVRASQKLILLGGSSEHLIGLGGGSSSSSATEVTKDAYERNKNSVQRGDPAMESPVIETVHSLALREVNPTQDIGDLGAGGIINNVVERAEGVGVTISVEAITEGRPPKLSIPELIANEGQERAALVVEEQDVPVVLETAERERCPAVVIGTFTGDNRIKVVSEALPRPAVDLPLQDILSDRIKRPLAFSSVNRVLQPVSLPEDLTFEKCLEIWKLVQGGCKKWLGDVVDRSVRGHMAGQSYLGPAQLPIADYGLLANSLNDLSGHVHSIGLAPLLSLIDPAACARMTLAESLLNMIGCYVNDMTKVKMIANWMWPLNAPGEGDRMDRAVDALCRFVNQLYLALIGGKDSLSMIGSGYTHDGSLVKVPSVPTLIISASAPVNDIRRRVTADLKLPGDSLYLIDLSGGSRELGGTQLAMIYNQLGDRCADVHDVEEFARACDVTQRLVRDCVISSVHDCGDDGLITALAEGAFAGNLGLNIETHDDASEIPFYFHGGLGLVVSTSYPQIFAGRMKDSGIPFQRLGEVAGCGGDVTIRHNGKCVLDQPLVDLREQWMERSFQMYEERANPSAVRALRSHARKVSNPPGRLTFTPKLPRSWGSPSPRVAIMREVGSNGHREMADMFFKTGFDPYDVHMTDLESGRVSLNPSFQIGVLVGGFSHSDVFGAGVGWANSILMNPRLASMFKAFRERPDTLMLGVCNGCQVLAQMGWVPDLGGRCQNEVIFGQNTLRQFMAAFVPVEIANSPSVWLKKMQGSILPIQIAHEEGSLKASQKTLQSIIDRNLVALRYVDRDDEGNAIWNGSPQGIAGLTSPDGRVLAMMPHVERCTGGPVVDGHRIWQWQWPWIPEDLRWCEESPWMQMAQSAREWCDEINHRLVS